ncbi:MAG TPA: hypothetical protein VH879_05885 [Gemmatimonadales bacterium]|jgi:hypothetical protein
MPRSVLALLLLPFLPLRAQAPDPLDWRFSSDSPRPVVLAGQDSVKAELEIDDTTPVLGLAVDLNGDGHRDLIVRSAPSLCGASGNCSFAVLDGAMNRVVGGLGGNLVVVRSRRIGGWPVMQTWWHTSAGSGIYTTYVFDGVRYITVASVPVEGEGLESLFRELNQIPQGP